MSASRGHSARRLRRLEAVFAGRRAHLLADVAAPPVRRGDAPLARLQAQGYPIAIVLGLAAALPTLVGFIVRRRKLIFSLVAAGLRTRKLRTWLRRQSVEGRR